MRAFLLWLALCISCLGAEPELVVTQFGTASVVAPSAPVEKAGWLVLPADPSFLVIDDGKRAVLAPSKAGSWWVILAYQTEAGQQFLVVTVTRGKPDPPVVPDPPDPDPQPEAGKRVVVILHETEDITADLARVFTALRAGPAASYLKDKGHLLSILDDDSVGPDGKPSPGVVAWREQLGGLAMPAVLIAEKTTAGTGKVLAKRTLTNGDNAASIIESVKKTGG